MTRERDALERLVIVIGAYLKDRGPYPPTPQERTSGMWVIDRLLRNEVDAALAQARTVLYPRTMADLGRRDRLRLRSSALITYGALLAAVIVVALVLTTQ